MVKMMNISYDYYKIFYYVAKYGSITRAADAMLYNQPNITRAIKKLESALNCTLLVRSNRGVKLTPEGEKLFSHISAAVDQIEAGEAEVCAERSLSNGLVTIGASEVALHCFLLPVLKRYKETYPGIRIKVANYSTPQAISALKSGNVDICVVTTPTGDCGSLRMKELCKFREIAVCGAAYAELAEQSLSLDDISKQQLIGLGKNTKTYEFYRDIFAQNGLVYSPDTEAATADQILPLVKSDLGIGFVPEAFVLSDYDQKSLCVLELRDVVIERYVCLLKSGDRPMSIAVKELERFMNAESERKKTEPGYRY